MTISFNLAPGVALSEAVEAVRDAERKSNAPISISTGFQGTAQAFQDSLSNQPLLLLAAVIVIYIVLGILYESFIHPITILSGLPSAGIGALLMLLLFGFDLSVIAIIGIVMLVGIVKKNAIMMVDFAITRRHQGMEALEAIREAALLRFRPIIMTTMAAFRHLSIALGTDPARAPAAPTSRWSGAILQLCASTSRRCLALSRSLLPQDPRRRRPVSYRPVTPTKKTDARRGLESAQPTGELPHDRESAFVRVPASTKPSASRGFPGAKRSPSRG